MDSLPDKVKRIDVLRVEYGKKKLCQCYDPHYEIDYQNRLVYCVDCGAIVDPFEALMGIAKSYDRISRQIEALLEQRREIASYKPHLVVIKDLERRYRAQNFSMVPCCPRCGEPFDLSELTLWSSRVFLKKEEPDDK
ncbi:hypothetical protein [Clostridium sp. D33t1_170424_F3]|uniref:hypothetical protein n=1 Tax=Clostridium sp. D33t1_170424_F3 TaxID=2787099 RepID=UPI0018AA54B1|nr:hypothetical protein [Clostridium sp. D33t1_170424_F3]